MTDYINGSTTIRPFYTYEFNRSGFENLLTSAAFSGINRQVLVEELKKQAGLVDNTGAKTMAYITSLQEQNVYTVTTGHQLCLFTGPLYFVYKILSAINLCETLQAAFPRKQFVPVYWMASEDHDFAEVNHAHVFGKTITWNSEQKGSVGEFRTEGIDTVLAEMKQILGNAPHAEALYQVFEKAYSGQSNLADATRYLVNALFGEYGLVVLDGNSKTLKSLLKKELERDIFENLSYQQVQATNEKLAQHYKVQVNPREINVFYKSQQQRDRIVSENNTFKVLNTELSFTKEQIQQLISESTDSLSPNVVLRPVYQQKILPNVAYVGGPGELAYWLEYKAMFEAYGVTFPVLVPRQFVSFIDKGTHGKLTKLGLDTRAIFEPLDELVNGFVKKENTGLDIESYKTKLSQVFDALTQDATGIDKTLQGAVEAEKQKALNGLLAVDQKITRALKQRSETDLNQLRGIKAKLFPENTPQERYDNISQYYCKYGAEFIRGLKEQLTYDLSTFRYVVLTETE
ncbi:MAG: bacillithiol biosynthesis cysteine-adding enzyme BshC [Bacteroidetes bacterium]|nr:bacillithiol biosynthesis cysteine-adding enzyme BshC [Bacteroidota bacterium]